MRVAVLADIHANLPALDAVLAEPDVLAGVAVVRDAVDHLAAHPEPDPADLETVARLLAGLAP